jgi:hypothetical protein
VVKPSSVAVLILISPFAKDADRARISNCTEGRRDLRDSLLELRRELGAAEKKLVRRPFVAVILRSQPFMHVFKMDTELL